MAKNYTYTDIENFLTNKLGETDRANFETAIANDSNLKKEVQFYEELMKSVADLGREDMTTLIMHIDEKLEQDGFFSQQTPTVLTPKKEEKGRVVKRRLLWRPMVIAASILLLLAVGMNWWVNQHYSNSALLEAYFEPTDGTRNIRSAIRLPAGVQHPLDAAFEKYEQEDYQDAIAQFAAIPETSELYLESRYLLAHTFVEVKDYEQAISTFEMVAKSNDIRFKDKAEWNLVQLYLQTQRSDSETTDLLDKIIEQKNHSYQKNALQLKQDLNSFWKKLE